MHVLHSTLHSPRLLTTSILRVNHFEQLSQVDQTSQLSDHELSMLPHHHHNEIETQGEVTNILGREKAEKKRQRQRDVLEYSQLQLN